MRDDNPYLKIDDLGEDLVKAELSVLENTIALLQILLPRFRKQAESRVCIISSMSAIRSVISGSMHMAAKGAISRFTNAAMIELDKEKIFISDIRP
ncbi:MAG: SDR family NAD(P)-dependent oxidoreductase [Candidatus Peribacteria bacterium]|nr:SDR family NAD(P)-dependent oxidoreductase [Candidatus Peribacteria bacterium]